MTIQESPPNERASPLPLIRRAAVLGAGVMGPRIAAHLANAKIEVLLLENYQGESATDAYGIAEPANIATAPAIANAVYNAIGVRLRTLPMTPAVVLAALGGLPQGR